MVLKSAEKDFVDSLSQTGKYGGKMSGIEHYVMNSTSNPDSGNDAIMGAQNIQISSYSQDNKAMSPIPKFRNMSHDRSYPVPPPNTEPRSFVFRLDQPENNPRYFRKNTSGPPPKPGKRRKSGNSSCSEHDDGNDSAVETDYQQPSKRNRANPAMYQSNDETTMPSPVDFIGDILSLTQDLEFPYPYPTPEDNLIYGLQESVLQTGDRIIDLQTGSFSKQVHCPIGFDESEFSNPNSCYYGMNDTNYLPIDFYEPSTQIEPIDNTPTNIYWPNGLPLDQFDQLEQFDQFDQFDQFVQC
jgi:hypothetical protein